MQIDLWKVINKLKTPLESYNEQFKNFLEAGRGIEDILQTETELLTEIRKKFDNLSATVELEFEGTSVFDQEIKKTKELLHQGIAKVNESLSMSSQVSEDLNNISRTFEKIHTGGIQLEDIIKNIGIVSDSIEVASRNAGITAFHAGKQGRGFEVIAREMTSLVRSSQKPTKLIPEVSDKIIKGMEELSADLQRIGNIISYLREIANKFTNIVNELIALVPEIESGLKGISESIISQKELHNKLIKDNETLSGRLDDFYNTTQTAAIIEIFLGAFFQHINNIKDDLLNVKDNSSFSRILNSFKIVLTSSSKKEDKTLKGLSIEELERLETESFDRLILQFVSESNHLHQTMESIANEIKNWSKTNSLALDVLLKGTVFYQDIIEILSTLNKKLISIKEMTGGIDNPLHELRRITERSRLLGLYAGIESARGGEYASSLGVVTKEIKDLSQKTTSFINKIGEIEGEMLKDFSQLASLLIKSMSDVEQGIASLRSAIANCEENRKVLENLDSLSQEMIDSTSTMINQCRELGEKFNAFDDNYKIISKDFLRYVNAIHASGDTSSQILNILNQYERDVVILEKKSKTIVFRENTDPIILDPANKTDAMSHQVIEQICTGLLTFDSLNHLIPGVADSFSLSKDGRVWDFTIKKGVKFHDDSTVTSSDVFKSIRRVSQGPNANFIDYVQDIIILDEYRIRFVLKYPYIPFLANLACGVCDITPQNFSADHPISCGPFRFVHWDKGREIFLEVFEDFFDGRAVIDRVIIKIVPDDNEALELFKKGGLSIMSLSASMVKEFPPEEIISGPVLSTQYIGINTVMDTPFSNKKVRQAMNYAIDKEYYAKVLMSDRTIPGHGILPPGIFAYNPKLVCYPYNLRKARDLMDEAGFGSGINDSFVFDIREGEGVMKRAEFIKESVAKIGISLTLNPLSWKTLLEKCYSGKSLLSLRGWISDNGDPDNFLYPNFHSKSFGHSGNISFYSNKEVDEMIEAARAERSRKRRFEMYQKIEQIIVNDAPWIFLGHGVDSYVVSKNIGGFKIDPFGVVRFRNLWSY